MNEDDDECLRLRLAGSLQAVSVASNYMQIRKAGDRQMAVIVNEANPPAFSRTNSFVVKDSLCFAG